jgi:enterochelin esterase family protein
MGGGHALRVGFDRPDLFQHVGVFSSGIFGPNGLPEENRKALVDFQHQHRGSLAATASRRRFPEFWFATGKRDFLLEVTRSTVGFLQEHGFVTTYHETEGGHTWDRWREYLHHYLPLLFRRH